MKIVNTEVVEIDGVKYEVDTYDTGAIVKYPWTDPDEPQPEPEPEPEETVSTAEMLEAVLINTEYIMALTEVSEEGI